MRLISCDVFRGFGVNFHQGFTGFFNQIFHASFCPGGPGGVGNGPVELHDLALHMGNSVHTVPTDLDVHSSIEESEWQLITDLPVEPLQPVQFAWTPRQPPQLQTSVNQHGRPLPVPLVSHPGMINSLPMVSQSKCRPAQPPPSIEDHRPRSLQFDPLAFQTCRPNPHAYEHQPPISGEKRAKLSHSGGERTSATNLIRTRTPSSIPYLVTLWSGILTALGSLSKVFLDISGHAQYSQLAGVILDAFSASTLHRYLTCISKFLSWCRELSIPLVSISTATVLDVLHSGSRNSGMKGSTVMKSLQWCRRQADVSAWSFLDSPLLQGWLKSKVPADRRESLPLPLYVVTQWERRLLQANIPQHELMIIGGFLLMIWSGLRYSDLQRVTVKSIVCSPTEIRGISWKTKTCSKGQPWGARASGFLSVGSVTWLSKFIQGWDAILASQPGGDLDFVIPQFHEEQIMQPYQPMSYPMALHWFRKFLTIPWKRSSLTESMDTSSYTIHGMKATLLSWSAQLCHQGVVTEEMRRLQGHHKPIQHSVSLYSRDDVNGQLELQRRLVQQVVSGWRPITPLHRGAQMPASEPTVVLERFRKSLETIQLSVLYWIDTVPTQVTSQVELSSDSDSASTSSSSSSSNSSHEEKPRSQPKENSMLAIGIHRFLHHAMIECTDKKSDVCKWYDIPVQTGCGRRFVSSRITLMEAFTPPEGTCCMHRGCQQWLQSDRD